MAFNKEQFIEDLKAMSVLELNEVVKAIEEEFGVSAAAVAAVAGPAGDAVEENPNKTVTLVSAGTQKVKVIQAIRAIDGSLGLKEAKAIADNGGVLADNIPAEDAAAMIAKLEEVGATAAAK